MNKIDEELLSGAVKIVSLLKKEGYAAYFAGGYPRDCLLKRPSLDIDIATSASVEELSSLFPHCYFVGASFGVIRVVINKIGYEVATFRQDLGNLDGRRPEKVIPSNIKMDAFRRDFTINGMFYDPINNEIFDYVGGRVDLERKIIRAIGDPEKRFEEDRLRMIRAVRFAVRFNFTIEPKTKSAVQKWAGQLFPSLSWERIVEELKKMSCSKGFSKALKLLDELYLLQQIFPSGIVIKDVEPFSLHTPLVLKLSAALHLPLDQKVSLFIKMKMSNMEVKLAKLFHNLEKAVEKLDRVKLVRLIAHKHSKICLRAYFEFYPNKKVELDKLFTTLQPFIKMVEEKRPLVSSADLKALGIKEGPLLGELLKEAEKIAILDNLQDKKIVVARCMRLKIWPL